MSAIASSIVSTLRNSFCTPRSSTRMISSKTNMRCLIWAAISMSASSISFNINSLEISSVWFNISARRSIPPVTLEMVFLFVFKMSFKISLTSSTIAAVTLSRFTIRIDTSVLISSGSLAITSLATRVSRWTNIMAIVCGCSFLMRSYISSALKALIAFRPLPSVFESSLLFAAATLCAGTGRPTFDLYRWAIRANSLATCSTTSGDMVRIWDRCSLMISFSDSLRRFSSISASGVPRA